MNVPAGPAPKRRDVRWTDVVILTLGMGVAVTVSWFAFARQIDSFSLDLPAMVRPARLMVYATQFLLVGALSFVFVRWRPRGMPTGQLAITAAAAWLGEGVVLYRRRAAGRERTGSGDRLVLLARRHGRAAATSGRLPGRLART